MEFKTLLDALVKASYAIEDARDETLRELRANPAALHNLESVIANLEYEIAIYKREIAKIEDATNSEFAAS